MASSDPFFGGVTSLAEHLDSAYLATPSGRLKKGGGGRGKGGPAVVACEPLSFPASSETVLLVLRDGRVLLGTLASYDQYCSVVLEHARERHVAGGAFADVDMGLYLVRGESIALLGEVVRFEGYVLCSELRVPCASADSITSPG